MSSRRKGRAVLIPILAFTVIASGCASRPSVAPWTDSDREDFVSYCLDTLAFRFSDAGRAEDGCQEELEVAEVFCDPKDGRALIDQLAELGFSSYNSAFYRACYDL